MAGSMPLPALLAPHDADGVAPCLPLEGNVIFLREANELRRWAMDGVKVTERLKRWGQHNGGRIFWLCRVNEIFVWSRGALLEEE